MLEVQERDSARIERVAAGDGDGFWDLVQPNHDDLKWCGSAPLYTFLKAVPRVRSDGVPAAGSRPTDDTYSSRARAMMGRFAS